MVIDGRGYDRALGPVHTAHRGACWLLNTSWALRFPLQYQPSGVHGKAAEAPTGSHGWKFCVRRAILVNSTIVSRQQTWRQQWESRADTHHWEDDTYKHRHWRCFCNTVTKQQETSHTDHWHYIVIEIWVSISPSLSFLSLSCFLFYFSVRPGRPDSIPNSWTEPPLQLLFLHLLLLCNTIIQLPFFLFCTPSSSSTETSTTPRAVSSLQLFNSVSHLLFLPLVLLLLQSSIHVLLLLLWPLPFPPHHFVMLLQSGPHLLVHLHSVHLLLHSSSETRATAADRCAFHTLFVSLFCHSTKLQRSSLITLVPLAACFCVSRLMFPAACWQRCQPQSLRCTWEMEELDQPRHIGSSIQAAHSHTISKVGSQNTKGVDDGLT